MAFICPICGHAATQFKPAGSVETNEGRYKLRACPRCNSDEWSRLVVAWAKDNVSFSRQGRILTLSCPLALRAGLLKMKNVSLVDGETRDLTGKAFGSNAYDLVVIGETWTQDAQDVATILAVRDVLRDRGWFILMALDRLDADKRTGQFKKLGFEEPPGAWARHEEFAVHRDYPLIAVQKIPLPKPKEPDSKLPLIYTTDDPHRIEIEPAPLARDWMDATDSKFPYLCLPMNIANTHGWNLKCPAGFSATWDGGKGIKAITITRDADDGRPVGYSNFGYGVLTFSAHGHFRTPPGIDLFVTGPLNQPKHGLCALSGIVENDWSDFFFTMNWLFTAPHHTIRFEKGEPYCTIFPVPRGLIEEFDPIIMSGKENPDLWQRYSAHVLSRIDWRKDKNKKGTIASKKKWQRDYFSGPLEAPGVAHKTKLKVRPFRSTED